MSTSEPTPEFKQRARELRVPKDLMRYAWKSGLDLEICAGAMDALRKRGQAGTEEGHHDY